MSKLGKLQKVDLRKQWNHEAFDFTQWLVNPENLGLLADEIGIELTAIEAEAKTGKYSVDVLAEEENTGRKVIIENQLEKTDHDHLGKIITYASGYDAEYIVWIVKDTNEEHRQALEWLNEHTDNSLNFFLMRLELWQIDDSLPAVKFNTVVKPNEWTKTLRETTRKDDLTETKLLQLDFWKQFSQYCQEERVSFNTRKPLPQHWYNISIGKSGEHLALTMNTRDNEVGCELYIGDNKERFDTLYEEREQIESQIEETLDWQRLDDKKASRIKITRGGNITDEESWEEYFEWLKQKAEKFKEVFGA